MAIIIPGILSLYIGEGWSEQVQRDTLLGAIAIASNGIFYLLAKRHAGSNYFRTLARMVLAADVLLVTFLIFIKGGVESRSPILYVIPIIMAAAILGRRALYITSALTIAAYDALIIADYHNLISSKGALYPGLHNDFPYVLNTVVFFTSVLLIFTRVADSMTKELVSKEKQALHSASALKRAQTIARLGSWEWDLKSGEYYWSDEMYRIFEHRHSGKLTKNAYFRRIHPEDKVLVKTQLDNALESGRPTHFDYRLQLSGGRVRYIHSEVQAVLDNAGKAMRVVGTAQDVTAERSLDNAKDEFVSLASHQLRTPATGVKAYLGMLSEGFAGKLTDKQQKLLHEAVAANDRQLQVIDGLLSVAGIESGRMALAKTPTDLTKLAKLCVAEQQPFIDEQEQEIEITKPSRPVLSEVDPGRLRMALDNLISNASKYTPAGGKITIKISARGNQAFITVSDTGIGIAKKDLNKLFVKFSRIHSPRSIEAGGTGLGLYVVKYLVNLHGGDVVVESKPNKGSTFTIRLNRYIRATGPLSKAKSTLKKGASGLVKADKT